jgi:hypothetical protein
VSRGLWPVIAAISVQLTSASRVTAVMSARLVSRRLPIRGRSGRSNRRNEEIDERFRSRIGGRGSASCRTTIGHKSCYPGLHARGNGRVLPRPRRETQGNRVRGVRASRHGAGNQGSIPQCCMRKFVPSRWSTISQASAALVYVSAIAVIALHGAQLASPCWQAAAH